MLIALIVFLVILIWGVVTEQFLEGVLNGLLYGFVITMFLSMVTASNLGDTGVTETTVTAEHELLAIDNNGSEYYVSADGDTYEVIYLDEEHILEYEKMHKDTVRFTETDSQNPKLEVIEHEISYDINPWYHVPIFLRGSKTTYEITLPEGAILHKFNIVK